MNTCDELAPLLAAHLTGDLSAEERGQIEAHLQSCEACRAEREALSEVLELAALPPPSELEDRALASFSAQTRSAWRAQERTTRRDARFAMGGLAALAAAVLIALSVGRAQLPGGHAHRSLPAAAQVATSAATASDFQLALDDMADGPVEYADQSTDPYALDPEVASTVLSEGDE